MAITRLTIDGFGQVELNNCAFPRDGRVEAQAPLKADNNIPVYENGMILAVDKAANEVRAVATGDTVIGLNYSAEHLYDASKMGLKNFSLRAGDYPRIGLLSVGDKFTTNTICYDNTANSGFATDDDAAKTKLAAFATTAVYGTTDASGAIKLVATKPASGVVLKVIKVYTMPDGQYGVRFQVLAV